MTGCVQLPTSGPSRHEVRVTAAEKRIRVVNVDNLVAVQLATARSARAFSDVFGTGSGSATIVGLGDIVEVSIWEAPPAVLFSPTLRQSSLGSSAPSMAASNAATFPPLMVADDGTIDVPFAGRITASGKSLQQIGADIAGQLQGKANKPQVVVRLVTNNAEYATVIGDVEHSTRIPLTPHRERLLDALAAAGGTKEPVGKVTLQLTRGSDVDALPLDTVIRDPRQNIPLRPGDIVTALYQPHYLTALGATGKSEELNFEAQGISLAQALARVGGLNDNLANPAGVFIFRFESRDALQKGGIAMNAPDSQVPVIYQVDLRDPRAFFAAQNFPMSNKDVMYVANAPGAELQKFINLLLSTFYPIEGAISLSNP
jgi:polysaccharide export outer membrane protein